MSYQEIERRASQKKHERTVGELNAQIEALVAQGEAVDPATAEWPSL